jgi:hypothetical protein
MKFYRVISDRANVTQFSIRNGDELTAGAVPLAKSAGAMAPQVRFWIAPRMIIIPKNPDDALGFNVINLGWESASHVALLPFQIKAQLDRPLRLSCNQSLCDSLNTSAVLCRVCRLKWRR